MLYVSESTLDAHCHGLQSLTRKAATDTLNQWEALNRYLENGELSIDNNASERAMRPVAIGKRPVKRMLQVSLSFPVFREVSDGKATFGGTMGAVDS